MPCAALVRAAAAAAILAAALAEQRAELNANANSLGPARKKSTVELHTVVSHCMAEPGKPSSWGHLYVDGSIEPLEFFTSYFSSPFPCEPVELVAADPPEACREDQEGDLRGKAVLVSRGECSFSQKAQILAQAGAVAMILRNNGNDALFPMPDTDVEPSPANVHDKIASVMIRERSGQLLNHHLRVQPRARVHIRGELSHDQIGTKLSACGTCAGSDGEERVDAAGDMAHDTSPFKPAHGGTLHVSPHRAALLGKAEVDPERLSLDYFVGYIGASLPVNTSAPLVVAPEHNAELCDPLEGIPTGAVVLAHRGACPFTEKMHNAFEAGAWAVLIDNSDAEIALPGSPDDVLNPFSIRFEVGTIVSSPIIFKAAGNLLRLKAEAGEPLYVRFEPSDLTLQKVKTMDLDMRSLALWRTTSLEHAISEEAISSLALELGFDDDQRNQLEDALHR
mmetsp:Transcript_22830/g.64832  ORF Transcript_22830/g.64832 Transcript_22830/m.64832 type:complete len:451 (+) Transcript_22830:159-1511(+)